jgi:glutamate dehydrogenase
MQASGTPVAQDNLERLVDELRRRVPAEELDAVAALLWRAYATTPADELAETPAAALVAPVINLWRLARQRKPGEILVRVYNPDLERDGWSSPHTAIDVVNDDMPFLLASTTGELGQRNRRLHVLLHPVLGVERDADGGLVRLLNPRQGGKPESWMHLEVDRETHGEEGHAELRERLGHVLGQVRLAVDDWQPMRGKAVELAATLEANPPPVDPGEVAEVAAFLRWLADDHFTFLGFRSYPLVRRDAEEYLPIEPGTGLGVQREVSPESAARAARPLPEYLKRFLHQRELLIITKSSHRSEVHRPVFMDSIGLRRFDGAGNVVGEDRFLGLFTSTAYSAAARTIPILDRKLRRVFERAAFIPGSHDAKALSHIVESFPRDELFQISEDDLYRIALGILQLQQRHRVALFLRTDEFERFVSALVYLPRDRYDLALRERFQAILERALGGEQISFQTHVTDAPLARVHFLIRTAPGQIPPVDLKALEAELVAAARTWQEGFRDHLVQQLGEGAGLSHLATYREAFPVAYKERFDAAEAFADAAVLERLRQAGGGFDARLYRGATTPPGQLRLKLYHSGAPLVLSDALPLLENLGARVEEELPFAIRPDGAPPVWIHDFALTPSGEVEIAPETAGEVEETLRRVWRGDLENGVLNRLVLACGLSWREVAMLRGYSRYLRQAGFTFSQRYMAETLVNNDTIARRLVELFHTHFDPSHGDDHRSKAAAILADIRELLDGVESADEDRILRGYLAVMRETLRTNYYQVGPDGEPKPYISFKLNSRSIKQLPDPKPMFEIWVYSPRTEGVHLRGGKVARGGIRWSDRREDFRTEILGLLKAQMVKNAVIVPVGSKGGFVVKQPPKDGGREAQLAEGIECYKTLVRGCLDLTDNIVGGKVVPPARVVRRDEDDTYLVVAADKGTATFSDIANGVSAEYGFWLADAFASGGSAGYDHKEMGITARGAWEAVKRHFRELGKDIQNETFTAVGVGDMSGDVFGNGMLLSPHTRLLAAFDHRHIFVDPDPDPAKSFAERQRMFLLPRSSWADYDPAAMSPGGGVFERGAKQVTVSDQVQELFGLRTKKVTPTELMQAILLAEVELLWLGGIGTFVKASDQGNAEVGDRANDAVRVDATQLRCKVIGEGANLGLTQRGRIEFALRGGKINTDAIDNSGGVDTSDHEVNIKIALNEAMADAALDRPARDTLLASMTDEVAALVLRDNYLQTQAISLSELRGVELFDQQLRMIRALEKAGKLDRRIEFLPDDEQARERVALRRGFVRPEHAVMLAYSKIALYEDLIASDVPDDPLLAEDLYRYFPEPMVERFRDRVEGHRLRREIIATYITNSTVNRVGSSFVFRMMEATGRTAPDVARAYTITRDAFELRELWAAIEALDNRVPASLQLQMLLEIARLTEQATLWFLQRYDGALDVSQMVPAYRQPLRELQRELSEVLAGTARRDQRKRSRDLAKQGVPEALADQVSMLRALSAGPDVVRLALESGVPVAQVAAAYYAVGERYGLDWLRLAAGRAKIETALQRSAFEVLLGRLALHQTRIVRQVIASAGGGGVSEGSVDAWAAHREAAVQRVDRVLEELRPHEEVDLAMLTIADSSLEHLAG